MSNKIKNVMISDNGNIAVFDNNGQQIPELQQSWFLMIIKLFKEKGYTGEELKDVEFTVYPRCVRLRYLHEYDNWEVY